MHCYKVSEQILCLGTDFYNHFEMAQYNAINPGAFSKRKRRIPSFHYLDASFIHHKPLCTGILGRQMYPRGPHKLIKRVSVPQNSSHLLRFPLHSLCIVAGQDHHIWEFSIVLLKNEAGIFLQTIFLCTTCYAWVFWEMLDFLLSQKDGLLLVSLV